MQLKIDEYGREIKSHGTYAFPIRLSHEHIFDFERHSFLWHWHTELEWTYIVEGEICYQVNDQVFQLKEGQGILCNSNVLHTGRAKNDKDCHYVSITTHPRMFRSFENSILDKQYVEPVINNTVFSCVVFEEDSLWQREILERLRRVERLTEQKEDHYEFQIYLLMLENWLAIWRNTWGYQEIPEENVSESRNVERLKTIFNFLHVHYAEKITLKDIAAQVNICEAECCRLFKKYMRVSLFDYLLDYRVERSTALLQEMSVTEVAARTGFSSSAYYTKIFKERMGCTPTIYKKNLCTK